MTWKSLHFVKSLYERRYKAKSLFVVDNQGTFFFCLSFTIPGVFKRPPPPGGHTGLFQRKTSLFLCLDLWEPLNGATSGAHPYCLSLPSCLLARLILARLGSVYDRKARLCPYVSALSPFPQPICIISYSLRVWLKPGH